MSSAEERFQSISTTAFLVDDDPNMFFIVLNRDAISEKINSHS